MRIVNLSARIARIFVIIIFSAGKIRLILGVPLTLSGVPAIAAGRSCVHDGGCAFTTDASTRVGRGLRPRRSCNGTSERRSRIELYKKTANFLTTKRSTGTRHVSFTWRIL